MADCLFCGTSYPHPCDGFLIHVFVLVTSANCAPLKNSLQCESLDMSSPIPGRVLLSPCPSFSNLYYLRHYLSPSAFVEK